MDSDFELLEAWGQGEAEAGNRLFHRHFDSVCWFFQNKVSDNLDDLIQETFLACVESRDRFRKESSFRAFILGVANNVLRSHYRTRKRKGGKIDFGVTSVHDLGPSPSMVLAKNRSERLLLQALRRIPIDFQVMLELYYWENLSGRELADVLGVPEGTARTRLRRAKQVLQEKMEELSESGEHLRTTIENLEGWARAIREAMDRDESP